MSFVSSASSPLRVNLIHVTWINFVFGITTGIATSDTPIAEDPDTFYVFVIAILALCTISSGIMFTLSAFTVLFLEFHSSRSHLRITSKIAWSIVGHGSAGWTIAFIVLYSVLILTLFLDQVVSDLFLSNTTQSTEQFPFFSFFMICVLVGIAFNCIFSIAGFYRCKYANRVRPEDLNDE